MHATILPFVRGLMCRVHSRLLLAGTGAVIVTRLAAAAQNPPSPVHCAATSFGTPASWVYVRPDAGNHKPCGSTWEGACSDIPSAVEACAGGHTCAVLVTPGRYKLQHSLTLPDGVHLYGGCVSGAILSAGAEAELIAPDGGFPAIVLDRTVQPYTGIDGFYLAGTDAQRHAPREPSSQPPILTQEAPFKPGMQTLKDPKSGSIYAVAQPSVVLYARSSTFSLRRVRILAGNGGDGADGLPGANGTDTSLSQYLPQKPTAQENFVNVGACGQNAKQHEIAFADLILRSVAWDSRSNPWTPHASPAGDPGRTMAASWTGAIGGGGGFEGGASFGLLLFGSHVTLDRVEVISGRGGNGGNGGDGGNSLPADLQPGRFPLNEPGAGGGGAGGWPGPAIGLLSDAATTLVETTPIEFSGDFLLSIHTRPSHGGKQGTRRDAVCEPTAPAGSGPSYSRNVISRMKLTYSASQ